MIRNMKLMKREPKMARARVGQSIFVGLLTLAIFWDMDDSDSVGIWNKLGCFFFVVMFQVMMNVMGTVLIFSDERPVFLRE